MSQFELDGADLALEKMIGDLERMREEEIRRTRQIGYAEYDRWQWRFRRLWQRLTGQKIMTRERWNSTVDRMVK